MGVLRGIEGVKGPWEVFTRTILDQEGVVRWKLILAWTVGCKWPRNVGFWVTGVAWSRSREGKGRWKMQETPVRSLGWEDPLEKEEAAHSSILAWRIPWTV